MRKTLFNARDACRQIRIWQESWGDQPLSPHYDWSSSYFQRLSDRSLQLPGDDRTDGLADAFLYVADWLRLAVLRAVFLAVFLFGALVIPVRSIEFIFRRWRAAAHGQYRTAGPSSNRCDSGVSNAVWAEFVYQATIVCVLNAVLLVFVYRPVLNVVVQILMAALGLFTVVLAPFAE